MLEGFTLMDPKSILANHIVMSMGKGRNGSMRCIDVAPWF